MDKIQQNVNLTAEIVCPCCSGTGRLTDIPLKVDSNYTAKLAKNLRKSGYSLREIAKMLGYKYPNSISFLLKKKV